MVGELGSREVEPTDSESAWVWGNGGFASLPKQSGNKNSVDLPCLQAPSGWPGRGHCHTNSSALRTAQGGPSAGLSHPCFGTSGAPSQVLGSLMLRGDFQQPSRLLLPGPTFGFPWAYLCFCPAGPEGQISYVPGSSAGPSLTGVILVGTGCVAVSCTLVVWAQGPTTPVTLVPGYLLKNRLRAVTTVQLSSLQDLVLSSFPSPRQ